MSNIPAEKKTSSRKKDSKLAKNAIDSNSVTAVASDDLSCVTAFIFIIYVYVYIYIKMNVNVYRYIYRCIEEWFMNM